MRKNEKGSITVFLSLIMLLVFSVVCTVIENSRISSSYARSNEITYMAMDSVFSEYAREIFEDYGIMVLWKDDKQVVNEYMKYVKKNSNYTKDYSKKIYDILGLRHKSSTISNIKSALCNGGEEIYNQIYDYMKDAVSEDVINKILVDSDKLSQNSGIDSFNDKLEVCSGKLEDMEKSVKNIYENINKIKNCPYNPKEILSNMKEKLEEIKSIEATDNYNRQVRDNLFDLYKIEYRKYIEWKDTAKDNLQEIINNSDIYFKNMESAKNYIINIENELENEKSSYQEELYEIMKKELQDLKAEVFSSDKDIYNVKNNKKFTMEQKEVVDNVIKSLDLVSEKTDELNYSNNKLSNYSEADTFIEDSYKVLCEAENTILNYNCKELYVNYSANTEEKKKNGIVEFVKKLKEDGIMGYVINEDISDNSIEINNLPSDVYDKDNIKWKNYSSEKELLRKALASQYIFDKFGSYINKSVSGNLQYEIEYILFGNESDRKNIKECINKIITIREGFNFLYLLKDGTKRNEAYELALTIVGMTGMPAVIRITQFLILGAWSYAESVVDVKDLLDGNKVSLIKKADEWNLSLSNISSLESKKEKNENNDGLLYEDYLRYLLISQDKTKQSIRILDIIQMNIMNKYNDKFEFKNCIIQATVNTEYMVKRVFSNLGFVRHIINYSDDKFIIKVKQTAGY